MIAQDNGAGSGLPELDLLPGQANGKNNKLSMSKIGGREKLSGHAMPAGKTSLGSCSRARTYRACSEESPGESREVLRPGKCFHRPSERPS